MRTRLTQHCARNAGKSLLGDALSYIAKYWNGFYIFLIDGRIEIDNNTIERAIRPIALNWKIALFSGHGAGTENWATIGSLVETCKLNVVDPLAYLSASLTAIVNGHRQSRIEELMPWNYSRRSNGKSPLSALSGLCDSQPNGGARKSNPAASRPGL